MNTLCFLFWWMTTPQVSQLPYMWRLVQKNQHSSSTWKSHETERFILLHPDESWHECGSAFVAVKKIFDCGCRFYVCLIASVSCSGLFWIFCVLGNKTVTLREKEQKQWSWDKMSKDLSGLPLLLHNFLMKTKTFYLTAATKGKI